MKSENNPGGNPNVNTGKQTGSEKSPDTKKTTVTKTKGEEVWKDPDPTAPERKNDPDPTKPEKQEGPYSGNSGRVSTGVPTTPKPYTDDSKQKKPAVAGNKNPAHVESKDDEEIGSLDEQDIDDQGITGEADNDEDFSEEDERKSA